MGASLVSSGVLFPASAGNLAQVNTLDDYEEGSWTPAAATATINTSGVQGYVIVGKLITLNGYVYNGTSTSGNWVITGVPINAAEEHTSAVRFHSASLSHYDSVIYLLTGSLSILHNRNGQGPATMAWSEVGTGHVQFNITYRQTAD